MKNVVMGLFDRLDDAEAVIAQLVASPLDLESIQVIHADTAVQRRVGLQAGLPTRSAVRTGAVLGALLGAAIGFAGAGNVLDGSAPSPFASLGPLLAMAMGAMLGILLGAFAGAVSDRLRIPGGHVAEVAAAIDGGATAVTVRTENLPTAKAIGDLCRRSGSKVLSTGPAVPEASSSNPEGTADFALAPVAAAAADPDAVPEAHAAFAPPWRRDETEATSAVQAPPPDASSTGTGLPDLEGDLLFPSAPPATAPDPDTPVPRSIRRGETVSTPDRTTQAVQPREHPASSPRTSSTRASSAADPGTSQPTEAVPTQPAPEAAISASPDPRGLDALDLSPRVRRTLQKAGIFDLADLRTLAEQGEARISALPGIGPAALNEVRRGLESQGIDIAAADSSQPDRSADKAVPAKQASKAGAKPAPGTKRAVPVTKTAPASKIDKAADSVLREIFGFASDEDA